MNTAGLARVTDSPRGAHRTADRAFKGEEKLQQCVSQIPPIKRNLYDVGSDWTGESKTAKFVFSSERLRERRELSALPGLVLLVFGAPQLFIFAKDVVLRYSAAASPGDASEKVSSASAERGI